MLTYSDVDKQRHLRDIINSQKLDYEQLCARYSLIYNDEVLDKTRLLKQYSVISFCAPFVLLEERKTGNTYICLFQHSPRYYFGFIPINENGQTKNDWKSDWIKIMSHFMWRNVVKEDEMDYPMLKSRTIDCPNCKLNDLEFICVECDNTGKLHQRAKFVNALQIFYTLYRDQQFVLYRFKDWFSVNITESQFIQDKETLQTPNVLIQASSTEWNGEQAGSAIERVPDNLRGFMYRVSGYGINRHVDPTNIMDYLVDVLDGTID